jgi:hypothetical protein
MNSDEHDLNKKGIKPVAKYPPGTIRFYNHPGEPAEELYKAWQALSIKERFIQAGLLRTSAIVPEQRNKEQEEPLRIKPKILPGYGTIDERK